MFEEECAWSWVKVHGNKMRLNKDRSKNSEGKEN